ncbi:hypothetical protein AB836_01370 [Rickettsiales bacterium (ex Bugula neritina AB1)]|nr:hypothetical protein AB836_01370 [Rickettsiales bacterium (ex Bugula neritina AB1)]
MIKKILITSYFVLSISTLKIGQSFKKYQDLYHVIGVFYQNCDTKIIVLKEKNKSIIPTVVKLDMFDKIIATGKYSNNSSIKGKPFFIFKKKYLNILLEVLFFQAPNKNNLFGMMLVENRNNQQKYFTTESLFNRLITLFQVFNESININFAPDYYLMTNIPPYFKEYSIYKMFYLLSKKGSVTNDEMYLNRNIVYTMGEIIGKLNIQYIEYDGCGNDVFMYSSCYKCDHGEFLGLVLLQFDKYCILKSYFTFFDYCPTCHKNTKKLPTYQFEEALDVDNK